MYPYPKTSDRCNVQSVLGHLRGIYSGQWRMDTVYRLRSLLVLPVALLVSCGGSSNAGNSTNGGGSQPAPPGAITVSSGATNSAVNITLPPPAANPAPNATMIGVAVPVSGGGTSITLANAPAVVHLGSLPTGGQLLLALTGTGLASGSGTSATPIVTSVSLSGPNDITVSPTVHALTDNSNNGVGVGVTITLAASTATGARTVYLQNAQGDITAFAGGLEILP
jgi:hypothetical protein